MNLYIYKCSQTEWSGLANFQPVRPIRVWANVRDSNYGIQFHNFHFIFSASIYHPCLSKHSLISLLHCCFLLFSFQFGLVLFCSVRFYSIRFGSVVLKFFSRWLSLALCLPFMHSHPHCLRVRCIMCSQCLDTGKRKSKRIECVWKAFLVVIIHLFEHGHGLTCAVHAFSKPKAEMHILLATKPQQFTQSRLST